MLADDIFEIMQKRNSCRNFDSSKPLLQEQVDTLLRCASLGPSAGDLRACSLHMISQPQEKEQLQKLAVDQKQVGEAAVICCVCAIPGLSTGKYGFRGNVYAVQDATIMGMNITYAATALGLDSCWVGAIDVDAVMKLLNLLSGEYPLSLICIGYRKAE